MSFFSSLQEYVSNSVAGLSLSPKRFSLSRTDTTIENSLTPSSTVLPVSPGGSRSASGDSNTPGFPKVLPSPGLSPLQPNHRRRTLECLVPAPPVRRPGGSFRQRSPKPPVTPTTERPSFCCRRLSWPDIDHQIQSGIQEVDGAYFESFPTLAWKQENKRQNVQRAASDVAVGSVAGDTAGHPVVPQTQGPMAELALGIAAIDYTMSPQEKDKLYIEMLYTIANAVGAPAPGGQYAHYKEDLYLYGQRAFGVPPDRHYRMLHLAGEEKPPIIVLSVIVLGAEGLEAKDANGFSDPYCMLGIQPVAAPCSPQPNTPNRTLSAEMCNDTSSYMSHSHSGGVGGVSQALSPSSPGGGGVYIGGMGGCGGANHEKLRKHHSFKLSFKRKEGRSSAREQRDSLTGAALPAKFIRATSVKPHTLNPRWNEKFRFDIDETGSDSLHLDIWDHDDESSVLEAVSKLNEVRGVRGLGRYFKQVCQSARQSSQDDFLGCVTIPLQDIPSTGMEGWFKLEARSQRSSVQGRIRLKMWLSTREDHGISEEDNWTELMQHESLYSVFIDYELKTWRKETWTWPGDLPGPALTILHQQAVQGDLTELQVAIAHFVGAARVYLKQPLDPKWVLQLLTDIEHAWTTYTLTREEEMWLAESFTSMLERWLLQLRHHRQLFPALHTASLTRLEYVLRSLAYLSNMKAFWKCCPFNKEIRGEIVASLRKGTPEWFLHIRNAVVARCQQQQALQDYDDSFVDFCAELYLHLQQGLSNYHPLFEGTNGIPYFSVVFKQLDKLLADEVVAFLTDDHHQQSSTHMQAPSPDPAYSRLILAVYLEVKDLAQFSQELPSGGDHKLLLPRCHEWFEPAVSCWLEVCKSKALQRVRKAVELQKPPLLINDPNISRVVRHNSSAVDIVAMFCQLRDFWRLLQWPRAHSVALLSQLLDCVCSAALLYADIVYQELVETGYFDHAGPYRFSEEMCVAANNLEYVYKFISLLENYFDFITLESIAVESQYHVLTNQLDSTLSQLQTRVLDILQRVGPQMQESLRKSMFHLAWSPDTLPTTEAVQPLFDYLWTNLQQLNVALLGQNFQRVLYEIWEYTLAELDRQTDGGDTTSAGTNAPESLPPLFHDRLHAALDLLLEFFHAEGQGLSVDALRSGQYAHVAQRLQYHRMDTESLLEVFLGQRLIEQQQIMMAGSSIQAIYGVLAVRAYFNHDSLCVEVLHARDIIPLDPNGFSDPFVIIELLPHRVFPHCTEQQTNVHKKTLHPVFDECFEFSVSLEQCRAAQAMIGFTVMDHDVLTANDFAGEAFLALGSIPGVTNATGLGVDNFHGLKPVELVLMQQFVKRSCIICAMCKTLQESQKRDTPTIRPHMIVNKLRLLCRNFLPGRQEDAHEFLRYLVEAMEKAFLNRFKHFGQLDARTKETTPLNQILGGYLRSAVRCLQCSHISTTFQHFQDLLLDIRKAQTLEEALDAYFSREKLDDESYHCESCQKKVPATKQFSLERAPMVLCIQLKRFSVTNNKISKHLQFRQRLDLTQYSRTTPQRSSTPLVYRLVAMVTHMGPAVSCGHYTAVAQTPCGNFYQFDDSMVRPISHQAVFNTNAYIMFYELESAPFANGGGASVACKAPCTVTSGALLKQQNGYTSAKPYGPELPPTMNGIVANGVNKSKVLVLANAAGNSSTSSSIITVMSNSKLVENGTTKLVQKSTVLADKTTVANVSCSSNTFNSTNQIIARSLNTTPTKKPSLTPAPSPTPPHRQPIPSQPPPLTPAPSNGTASTKHSVASGATKCGNKAGEALKLVPYEDDEEDGADEAEEDEEETSGTSSGGSSKGSTPERPTIGTKATNRDWQVVGQTADPTPAKLEYSPEDRVTGHHSVKQPLKGPYVHHQHHHMSSTYAHLPTSSNTVNTTVDILRMGGHSGYGQPVCTWAGARSTIDRQLALERRDERKRSADSDMDAEMDMGRMKLARKNGMDGLGAIWAKSNPGYNPMQEFHNVKNWNKQTGAYNRSFYSSNKHRNNNRRNFHQKNGFHNKNRYRP